MVQIKRDAGKTTWLLEGERLSERLDELTVIFNHHSKENGTERIDPRFMAEILALQTGMLAQMARHQEAELERLRALEQDVARLKALLEPPAMTELSKPALKTPQQQKHRASRRG